jgi:hypothetical protein
MEVAPGFAAADYTKVMIVPVACCADNSHVEELYRQSHKAALDGG